MKIIIFAALVNTIIVVQNILDPIAKEGIKSIYEIEIDKLEFQETRKDFEGDVTIVVFSLLRQIKGNPFQIATELGKYLKSHAAIVTDYNVVKGFLNLVISDAYYIENFNKISKFENFGIHQHGGDQRCNT